MIRWRCARAAQPVAQDLGQQRQRQATPGAVAADDHLALGTELDIDRKRILQRRRKGMFRGKTVIRQAGGKPA